MDRKRMERVGLVAIAALLLMYLVGLAPAYGDAPAGRVTAAIASFPGVGDASCGTLLKTATSWPPAGPGAWLYPCSDTSDVWAYVANDGQLYWLGRGFVSFDTSNIPPSSTVVSATLRLSPRLVMLTKLEGTTLDIVSSSQGSTLEGADYGNLGATALASQRLSALHLDQVNSLPLNAGGLAAINKGGKTQLGLRLGMDLNGQAPQPEADGTLGGAQIVVNLEGLELTVTYQDPTSGANEDPALTLVEPNLVAVDALTPPSLPSVTFHGQNFRAGAIVYLLRNGVSHWPTDVQVKDSTTITARLPMGLSPGSYDVLVANSDGSWVMLGRSFTVTGSSTPLTFRTYLPLLNNWPANGSRPWAGLNSGLGP